MLHDLRYAVRILLKSPGFTAVAVITLALGLGANSAIFSLIDAVLLQPVPGIAEPERLVTIGRTDPETPFDNSSYPNYRDLREQTTVFTGIAAYHHLPLSLSGEGRAERVAGQLVTANYLDVLGVRMARGRWFIPAEDVPNAVPVAVISHSIWVRRFGADPNVVGRTVAVNGLEATVVGVAGQRFRGTETGDTTDVWLPLAHAPALLTHWVFARDDFFSSRNAVWIMLVARLKPGVSFAAANAETKTVFARLRAAYSANKDVDVRLMRGVGLDPESSGELLQFSGILLGVVGLLLLLACANVANLALARGAARRKELALRMALGAGRGRIVRQLLAESVLVALLGGTVGLVLGMWVSGAVPKTVPYFDFLDVATVFDWRVFAFTLIVSAGTGILFGIVPALQSSRVELQSSLKESPGSSPHHARLRSALVVGQLTISLVLLIGAGLLLRTLHNYGSIDPGFNDRNLAMVSVDPSIAGDYNDARLRLFHEQLLARVRALPGVEAATMARIPPVNIGGWGMGITIPDKPGKGGGLQFNTVEPGYFEMLGIPIVRGRAFTPADNASSPLVAVINETAARNFWPGEEPVGKIIRLHSDAQPRRIIGVARDIKYRQLTEAARDYIYYPMSQPYPMPHAPTTILLRARLPLDQVATAVAREVQIVDANVPVYRALSFDEHLGKTIWAQRAATILITAFAFVSFLLGTVGIYGVMAYAVTQRTHEVGIRMALGARPDHVLKLMLSHAVRMTVAGVIAGIAGALALTRVLSSLLYGVSTTDTLTFAVVAVLLAAVALLASYLPARRATKVDPMVALRYQ